jgi:hypothetical protein
MFRIAIKWLTVAIFSLLLTGVFFGPQAEGIAGKILPFGLFLFAFVWMPTFLFYAYDRRQQRKAAQVDSDEQNITQ